MYISCFTTRNLENNRYSSYYSSVGESEVKSCFNLRYLNASLKKSYKLIAYKTHPLHKILLDIGLINHPIMGHWVAVDDPALAVWLKLAQDQLGKKRVEAKFRGFWGPIDESLMDDLSTSSKELLDSTAAASKLKDLLYRNRSHVRYISNLYTKTYQTDLLANNVLLEESEISMVKEISHKSKDLSDLVLRHEKVMTKNYIRQTEKSNLLKEKIQNKLAAIQSGSPEKIITCKYSITVEYFTWIKKVSHRKPPLPEGWESPTPGTCKWCGLPIPDKNGKKSRATWHEACVLAYKLIHWPSVTRRAVWRRDHGRCRSCGVICPRGSHWHVDHIQPLIQANGDISFWKMPNLQTLCLACHNKKTSLESKARAKARADAKRLANPPILKHE